MSIGYLYAAVPSYLANCRISSHFPETIHIGNVRLLSGMLQTFSICSISVGKALCCISVMTIEKICFDIDDI